MSNFFIYIFCGDNCRVMSRSHVQGHPSYVRFKRFGVADNGRLNCSRIFSAIAQSITMTPATLSDLLVSQNRLMSGRFEVSACTEREFRISSLIASWRFANFSLHQSVLLTVMLATSRWFHVLCLGNSFWIRGAGCVLRRWRLLS